MFIANELSEAIKRFIIFYKYLTNYTENRHMLAMILDKKSTV